MCINRLIKVLILNCEPLIQGFKLIKTSNLEFVSKNMLQIVK